MTHCQPPGLPVLTLCPAVGKALSDATHWPGGELPLPGKALYPGLLGMGCESQEKVDEPCSLRSSTAVWAVWAQLEDACCRDGTFSHLEK